MIGRWVVTLAAEVPELELDPERVTPGIGGFLVFFALGIASWLLYRSFATHMRRVDLRARRRAEEEEAARRPAETSDSPGGER